VSGFRTQTKLVEIQSSIDRRNAVSRRLTLVIAGALLVLAACGSSGSATPTAAAGGGSSPALATTDQGGATTPEPATTDDTGAATPPPNGGGSLDACKLLTADEVASATGLANVTAGEIPLANLTDAEAGCAYVSGGTVPAMNLIYLASGVNSDPNTLKLLPGSEDVPLNGATAVWAPGAGQVMMIFKSGKVVMVQDLTPLNDDIKATDVSVAQKIADRM
jgi:hypothetical protein